MSTEMEGESRFESTYRNGHTENRRNQQNQRTLQNNWGFTESEKEKQMKDRQKFEEEWEEMEASNNSQKANQTDPLEALRFKMEAKS